MGINKESLAFIIKTITDNSIDLNNCRMVELGNQALKGIGGVAKYYFQDLGVDHVSIDKNGLDGAIKLDLQKKIEDPLLVGAFDVLTNFGTTEHILSQYVCWMNIHKLVKQGGIFIHLVPRVGHWHRHGDHKYNLEFFQKLAAACDYTIVKNFVRKADPKKDLICCTMIKKRDNKFIDKKIFETMGINK